MADFDIRYEPITVNNNPATVNLTGLNNIQQKLSLETLEPLKSESKSEFVYAQPFVTESKLQLEVPFPIKTENTAELDIKPLVFDQCLTIRLDPLPPTRICQPYQTHFRFTLFGVELFGFSLEGQNETQVTGIQRRPQVSWGETQTHPAHAPAHEHPPHEIHEARSAGTGPLRIRLGD